jgi:sugar (pentulose or hexulose) kinase
MLFLGVDLGTQAVKVIAADESGRVVASASQPLAPPPTGLPPGWAEQDPHDWWRATGDCLREATTALREAGRDPREIRALAVDSTSGTVVPVDAAGDPVGRAIMYHDNRCAAEAEELNEVAADLIAKLGYRFSFSFALAKILWVKRHEPDRFQRTARFRHAADFIAERLVGGPAMTDTSNALKTGYDLVDGGWPASTFAALDLPLDRFPEVARPGDRIGVVSAAAAAATGLAAGTEVVGGATDGTASFIASGAVAPGEWNSTLGTTLVVRGVSRVLVKDPLGRIYCHAHPMGYWLPGGASSTGGECLKRFFAGENWARLDREALACAPTPLLVYPLARIGERLPFHDPQATGFTVGEPRDTAEWYAAHLEGVGFVERWIYEVLAGLGAEVEGPILATGGGARSEPWLAIRAAILDRALRRPRETEAAFGSCIIAASKTAYANLEAATRAMVGHDLEVEPEPRLAAAYAERYQAFRDACRERGYA